MVRDLTDYAGGLVYRPAFVLWTRGRGWRAEASADSRQALEQAIRRRGYAQARCRILPAGQIPEE